MTEKNIKARLVNKHDIEEHWQLATNFAPLRGELIIYDDRYTDAEDNEVIVADRVRFKIGDGVTNVNDLPFMDDALIEIASAQDIVVLAEAQAYTDAALNDKANSYDDALTTTDKTIVGAINEINAKIAVLAAIEDGNEVAY